MVSASALSNDETDGADRGSDPGRGEAFAERQRRVLRPVVVVMDQPGQVGVALTSSGPDRLLECVDDEPGGHGGDGAPTQDPAGVGVDEKGNVDPARRRRDIGDVGNPQLVRGRWGEPALHQVP